MKTQWLILQFSHLSNSLTFYIDQITLFLVIFTVTPFYWITIFISKDTSSVNTYQFHRKTWVNMVNIATTLLFLTDVPSHSAGMFHFFFLWIFWNAASNHSYDFKNDASFWNYNCSADSSCKSGTGLRQRWFHQMRLPASPFPFQKSCTMKMQAQALRRHLH